MERINKIYAQFTQIYHPQAILQIRPSNNNSLLFNDQANAKNSEDFGLNINQDGDDFQRDDEQVDFQNKLIKDLKITKFSLIRALLLK